MAHALVLQLGSHHFQAPLPRSAEFDSYQYLRLFGLQQVVLAGWSASPGPLYSHLAPAPPRTLCKIKIKRTQGR